MLNNDTQSSVLLDRVSTLINQKLHEQAPVVDAFAALLYRDISPEDLKGRNDSDLYGAMLSVWNLLNQRQNEKTLIRVFNPELSRHGWHSTHSVVEIIVKDMPFLVDSVRMALKRLNLAAHLLIHHPVSIERKDHKVVAIKPGQHADHEEQVTVFLIEIDRLTDEDLIDQLSVELHSVIRDVQAAVSDWKPMRNKLVELSQQMAEMELPPGIEESQRSESLAFLNWLVNDNFTLMGYREYKLQPVSGDFELQPLDQTSLGLMRASVDQASRRLSELPDSARQEALRPCLLILTKSNALSRVHRPAHIDYIGIKQLNEHGKVIGEHRFIGLYAASFYNRSAINIPLIGAKIERTLARAGFDKQSHAYKAIHNLLETYPRDELLQASELQLSEIMQGVLQMQEREMTRLFVRRDTFGRFYSCMVYVPRERYNTLLRQSTQKILAQAFDSQDDVEFTTWFSESGQARTHYIVRVADNNQEVNVKYIEQNLIEAARSWDDKLAQALSSEFGEEQGKRLHNRFGLAFPRSYQEEILPTTAVADIEQLESLSETHKLGMLFFQPQEDRLEGNRVRLKLFHRDQPIHLSDVLPMLENFGLRVINERPYQMHSADGQVYWILDFGMIHQRQSLDLESCQGRFQEAFSAVWAQRLEDDGFNRLILSAGLSGREASVLRAYAKYMRQIGTSFSQSYIEQTLEDYPKIAALLFKLFNRKFNPRLKLSTRAIERLQQEITDKLEQVDNLDDDRIIRRYLELIDATTRTNFFQQSTLGNEPVLEKDYLSFKLEPHKLSEMPLPLPRYEIFVYSPRVEGVHLRGGKVARGGLRWSDRREDFRTEILGLVKAQQVKNTVIVPVGAKGGFVCKRQNSKMTRDQALAEGQACYQIFIRGLLDITDNIVNGQVSPPEQVLRHDEDDTYLVVAADKGTATFSDLANAISQEYAFWLGDAFASGGSIGYDHKKMGITARGAWESVKRHFREIGIDCQSEEFTVLAVGDMAGDVFGNGMLLSETIRLRAAFNHLHIFIDPEPDAASSFAERKRLFELPRSSWEDYNSELISEGGGIFSRRAKSIRLTSQIKKMIGTQKSSMTPNELIQALLQMEVDLLWNGGIGTYVKGSQESHIEVGDRANDSVRINGDQLKARIVGEGGNLGLTQLGRIEYAAQGGRINTDFIDNVGGVDCSDAEVNLKILLNQLVSDGELTVKQRNKLLVDMTDEVAELVLQDCYEQTGGLSVTELYTQQQVKEHARFIQRFERNGKLDRNLEFLPNEEELAERHAANQGFSRPELSVLTAYAKMDLKEILLDLEIIDDPWYEQLLLGMMPKVVAKRFKKSLFEHPLRKELVATQLANQLVNEMGITFVTRLQDETGASLSDVITGYSLAREIFSVESIFNQVAALDNQVSAQIQGEMLYHVRRQMRRATRWILRNSTLNQAIGTTALPFRDAVAEINQDLHRFMIPAEADSLKQSAAGLTAQGVPEALALQISNLSTLFSVLDIVQMAEQIKQPLGRISELYYKLGATLELHWFLREINRQPVANHWQAMARAAYREDLDSKQRELTAAVLKAPLNGASAEPANETGNVEELLEHWQQAHSSELERWHHMLADFKSGTTHEFAKFSVALRELSLLCYRCQANT